MRWGQRLALRLIERYQARGGGREQFRVECNFHPSCSEYGHQAITHYGLIKGLRLTLNRIRRCNQPDLIRPINDPLPRNTGDSHA